MSREHGNHGATQSSSATLTLTRFLNATEFAALPPLAIEHAKMILASTLSSAAVGVPMDSARIQRELALAQGGNAESTLWFVGNKLPPVLAARVNAAASDAAASDDSDLRDIAHFGTTLTSAGLALGEREHVSGRDLLLAMVLGYEAGGRIGRCARGWSTRHARVAARGVRERRRFREVAGPRRRADGARARHHRHHGGRSHRRHG